MGGDGASIDDELRKSVETMMNELTIADLTADELRQLIAIIDQAHERRTKES